MRDNQKRLTQIYKVLYGGQVPHWCPFDGHKCGCQKPTEESIVSWFEFYVTTFEKQE